MFRFCCVITIVLSLSCTEADRRSASTDLPAVAVMPSATPIDSRPSEPEYAAYPEKTIDEVFPVTTFSSSLDDDGREEDQSIDIAGYTMRIKNYVPHTLLKDGKVEFVFKKREPEGYWGTVVGVSHLRGPKSEDIYVAISGPGGVCCTNYSIIDISSGTPKSIFHSEDFGYFRNPMEVFDADGDGVYELVQFDSCMRYFLDDCGSCSPEPRVHFRYDRVQGQYLPAALIQQAFVRESMASIEKWIDHEFKKWKSTRDLQTRYELDRSLRSYVADLLHIGAEQKAWAVFKRYGDDSDGKERKEIKRRLAGCKFYQALRQRYIAR